MAGSTMEFYLKIRTIFIISNGSVSLISHLVDWN